jgi:hypothetical protein
MTRIFLLTAVLAACAAPAFAQTPPPIQPFPGQAIYGAWPDPASQAQYQADQHRYEMERLRAQAEQRDAFARQQTLESRLRVMDLQAGAPPAPVMPTIVRPLRSPEEERALRESATARRATTSTALDEIDSWLDRSRD